MADQHPLLETRDIAKQFPGVTALAGVDFRLRHGEIHALMGENGAGKSTLIKILTGVEHADGGSMLLDGAPYAPHSPHHAQQLGISTVYQEVNLCGNLSVAENIFIGRLPRRLGIIDWKSVHERSAQALRRLEIDIDVRKPLGSYSVAIQQMVAIARAIDVSAKVLILDEPTSSLDAREVAQLFAVMKRLREQGLGIIFITHFLDQVYEVSDQITVLRQGNLVGSYAVGALSRLELVSKMIGHDLETLDRLEQQKAERASGEDAPVMLDMRGVGRQGTLQPIDLQVRAGEVVGLAGLLGSGRTEAARLMFGVDQADSGSLSVGGRAFDRRSPARAVHHGIGLCPENRRADGIVPDLTVRENIILALQASRGWVRRLSTAEQQELADRFIRVLGIKTPDAERPIRTLSGGNQQKVILARWLATNPQVLILDEPTRGVDIGAKAEIQKLVLQLASDGKAVVFISSELDEVIRCSHTIAVMRDRSKVAELRGAIDEAQVLHAIAERPEDGDDIA
ncbi:sugar ABC transporter ATP-binding protein [Chloroflexia bacterium SDU3-3]|nr:sugar ABC transporter ATP-binding protein [Chloroflexia bacterium SDU3-3]